MLVVDIAKPVAGVVSVMALSLIVYVIHVQPANLQERIPL